MEKSNPLWSESSLNVSNLPSLQPLAMPPPPLLIPLTNALSGQHRLRSRKRATPESLKDWRYFERRKRNNAAAKKSREQRKQREKNVLNRAKTLEKDNVMLKLQVSVLRQELARWRSILLQRRLQRQRLLLLATMPHVMAMSAEKTTVNIADDREGSEHSSEEKDKKTATNMKIEQE